MSLLILESYETVDLPLPDVTPAPGGGPSEQERKVLFWTNVLLPAVPADELREAFDLAVARHEEPRRPVNPYDVKNAYHLRLAERERQRRADEDEERRAGGLKRCVSCGGEGLLEIWLPATGESVVLPCQSCRPRAFAVAVEQFAERRKQAAPAGGSVVSIVEAAAALGRENKS